MQHRVRQVKKYVRGKCLTSRVLFQIEKLIIKYCVRLISAKNFSLVRLNFELNQDLLEII